MPTCKLQGANDFANRRICFCLNRNSIGKDRYLGERRICEILFFVCAPVAGYEQWGDAWHKYFMTIFFICATFLASSPIIHRPDSPHHPCLGWLSSRRHPAPGISSNNTWGKYVLDMSRYGMLFSHVITDRYWIYCRPVVYLDWISLEFLVRNRYRDRRSKMSEVGCCHLQGDLFYISPLELCIDYDSWYYSMKIRKSGRPDHLVSHRSSQPTAEELSPIIIYKGTGCN